jgi:glyoxylase-like metal-dependent hydrolase (beta-lactamase superfamily II)
MDNMLTRRRLLHAGLAGTATLALPAWATLGAPASNRGSTALHERLRVIHGAGGNVVACSDGEALLLVDGGRRSDAGSTLARIRRELGTRRIATLINTHWHPDGTGLNGLAGQAKARIIAHENTRLWLSTDVRYTPDGPPLQRLPAAARPNASTYSGGEIGFGQQTVRYGHAAQAHTDGDLWVKFVEANVLVTGGIVNGAGWPTADWVTGGWINGTVAGYRTLLAQCDDQTRIVTGHGTALMTRAELESERAMLAGIAEQLTRMLRKGFAPADVLEANPAREHEARYGDAREFLTESFRSLWPRLAPDA